MYTQVLKECCRSMITLCLEEKKLHLTDFSDHWVVLRALKVLTFLKIVDLCIFSMLMQYSTVQLMYLNQNMVITSDLLKWPPLHLYLIYI